MIRVEVFFLKAVKCQPWRKCLISNRKKWCCSLSEANLRLAGEVYLNCAWNLSPQRRGMPPCRVTRPKGELISQKSGHQSTFLTKSHRHPLLFDANYPLTSKNSPPILPSRKRKFLSINSIQFNRGIKGRRQVAGRFSQGTDIEIGTAFDSRTRIECTLWLWWIWITDKEKLSVWTN